MSEENKENGFNHVKTFTKIIFIFSVLVFNDNEGNDSNLLIVFYVQIMPDDFVMQLHRF